MTKKILLLIVLSLFLSKPAEAIWCDQASAQGCWLMDFDEDPIRDDSQNSNTGALTSANNPDFVASCQFGGCYDFDGSDDINLGQDSSIVFTPNTDDFTIMAWIKTVGNGAVIAQAAQTSESRQMYMYVQDSLVTYVGGTQTDSGVVVDTGNWEHVAVVNYDDSGTQKHRLVINGTTDDTVGTSGSSTTSLDVLIGARRSSTPNSGQAFQFTGQVDEAAIFSDEKDDTDINDIIDNGLVQAAAAGRTRRMF